MSAQILFSGYYGLGNAGDEAVLAASAALFRSRRPELKLTALSADPGETRKTHGLDAAPRMSPATLAAIRKCDLFLSGGGSLLQDRTSLKSLFYYLFLLDYARRKRKRTMVFAQGIGPLIRPIAQRMTVKVLSQLNAITVRDIESADLLRQIGLPKQGAPEVEITADPVFALEAKVTDRVTAAALNRPVIGISLRPWPGIEQMLEPLASALEAFEGLAALQAWPLQPSQDLPVCEALAKRFPAVQVMREPLNAGEWMALAGWTDVVVGMRLHSLIFAAARAVPAVGISYDPKVDALLSRLKIRAAGTVGALDAGVLRLSIEASLEFDERRRQDREMRSEHLRKLATRNIDRALDLL